MLVYLIHSRFKIACMQHKCVWTRYDISRFHIQKLISATVRHNLMRAVYICTYLYTHVVVVLASSTIVASGKWQPRPKGLSCHFCLIMPSPQDGYTYVEMASPMACAFLMGCSFPKSFSTKRKQQLKPTYCHAC